MTMKVAVLPILDKQRTDVVELTGASTAACNIGPGGIDKVG